MIELFDHAISLFDVPVQFQLYESLFRYRTGQQEVGVFVEPDFDCKDLTHGSLSYRYSLQNHLIDHCCYPPNTQHLYRPLRMCVLTQEQQILG